MLLEKCMIENEGTKDDKRFFEVINFYSLKMDGLKAD